MQDLSFTYTHNGETIRLGFDNIFNFEDAVNKGADIPMDGTNVSAIFFENPLNTKQFDTVADLLEHCKVICR